MRETLKTVRSRAARGARRSGRPVRATVSLRHSSRRCHVSGCCSPRCRHRSCAACWPSSTTWRTCARARSDAARQPPPWHAMAASCATASIELDDLRGISARKAADRRDGGGRARPDRHRLLKIQYNRVFGITSRSRSRTCQRSGRLSPQTDDCRRRTLHYASAEGMRKKCSAPTSGSSSGKWRSSRRCGTVSPPKRRACRIPPRTGVARRAGVAAETAAVRNYTKPLMHGDELVAADAPRSRRAPAPDAFVPNDARLDAVAQLLS